MLYTHNGEAIVDEGQKRRDVRGVEEIAVDEKSPSGVGGEEGGEEAGEGELGALRRATIAPVEATRPELGLLDWGDSERNGGMLQE